MIFICIFVVDIFICCPITVYAFVEEMALYCFVHVGPSFDNLSIFDQITR